MKSFLSSCFCAGLSLAGAAVICLLALGASAQTGINPVPHNIGGPKSIFEDPRRRPGCVDPFFPKTERIQPPKVVVTPGKTNEVPQIAPTDPCKDIILKGISSVGGRRFALINNQTLETGETAKIRTNPPGITPGTYVTVTVVEIKERSVLIKCEGATEAKEIYFLRN